MSDELDEQPVPSETTCPHCGAEPTDETARAHHLSDLGYMHDDVTLVCSDCEESWVCGVPIGNSTEFEEKLWCDSCDNCFGLVHRVDVSQMPDMVKVHMKCPNDDCHHFWVSERYPDEDGVALIGYPKITGQTEGARAYGYNEDESPSEN